MPKFYKQNKKKINPRYFLNETIDRNNDGDIDPDELRALANLLDGDKMSNEELNEKIAMKIAERGLSDGIEEMDDSQLKDIMIDTFAQHFDQTGEGWEPYDEDVQKVRQHLTVQYEEDYEEPDFDDEHPSDKFDRKMYQKWLSDS